MKILKALFVLLFLAGSSSYLYAQKVTFTWEQKKRNLFLKSCIKALEPDMHTDSARQYCYCILYKFEGASLNPEDISNEVINEPKWQREIKDCLAVQWPTASRESFLDGCLKAAIEDFGQEKGTNYCQCMLFKIERYYRTPEEFPVDNVSEIFQTTYWQKQIKDCLGR